MHPRDSGPIQTEPLDDIKSPICRGCKKNLTIPRKKFDWYISKGYSNKDAAAAVLYTPSVDDRVQQIRTCCIVALETDYDSNREMVDRMRMRARVKQRGIDEIKRVTGQVPTREIVRIFAANENMTAGGKFIIRDSDDANISNLVENIKTYKIKNKLTGAIEEVEGTSGGTGFAITDIRQVPKKIMNQEQWDDNSVVLALWSQDKKIIPVVHQGNEIVPGSLWLYYQTTDVYGNKQKNYSIMDSTAIDKSLLGAEIIGYVEGVSEVVNGILVVVDAITLRKQYAQDIVG